VAPAAEHAPDRPPELPRQVVGLVEAAPQRTNRVERDWNDRINAVEHVASSVAQQLAERLGQLPAALVLERVQ
jgi:hypothetical protein